MAFMATARCTDCDTEYPTTAIVDHGLCPRCQRLEDQRFVNDTTSADLPPWRFSRRAMQDRLGVTGEADS